MTFKEYFLFTKKTAISYLIIVSKLFMVVFIVLFFAMAIGGKLKSGESLSPVYSYLFWVLFLYTCTLLSCVLMMINSYIDANSAIRLFNNIPLDIRDKLGLYLYHRQENIKYDYLEIEILGLFEGMDLQIRKNEKKIRVFLYITLSRKIDYKYQVYFNKKYKRENIKFYCSALSKDIKRKDWNRLSVNDVESVVKDLIYLSQLEKL